MPITDNYFVQNLLQCTTHGGNAALLWTSKESEGFRAALNGVQLDLDSVPTRGGPRIYLTLSCEKQRVYIEEPLNTGVVFEGYDSEGQGDLARLMRELFCAVAEQRAEQDRMAGEGTAREALFRMALFGERPDGQSIPALQPKRA